METAKTRDFVTILKSLQVNDKKVTILASEVTENIWLSSRNVKNLSVLPAESASAYDLLDNQILLVDKAGIEALNNQLAN